MKNVDEMVVGNYCNKQETCARRFTLPFTCKDCELNEKNYQTSNNAIITYISASGKEIQISEDSELSIHSEKSIGNSYGVNSANNIGNEKPIDNTDFKDALLASLYSQVEFLRNQFEEKDLLIRTLIIRDGEELVQAVPSHNNIRRDSVCNYKFEHKFEFKFW